MVEREPPTTVERPLPLIRCTIAGVLMGLANLVPGVSGGTMILIMGLYDEVISAVADATRLRFTRRSVILLGIVAVAAGLTIILLAAPLLKLMQLHRAAMYALFIGLTLGGVPLLWKMIRPVTTTSIVTMLVGLLAMVAIGLTRPETPELSPAQKAEFKDQIKRGEFSIERAPALDLAAGVLGMSAMVLPGVSGSYMLLLLGRYEQILAAISMAKTGDPASLHVIIPVAIGALVSLIVVTNILKWLLRRHEKPTLGLLLGILLGSVVALGGMVHPEGTQQHAVSGLLLIVGFLLTIGLSRIGAGHGANRESRAPGPTELDA